MKPILIIKTGSMMSEFLAAHQDFDDMIISNAAIDVPHARIVSVFAGEQLPDPNEVSGAIITGSVAMVTDREPWSVYTEKWVRTAAETGLPMLGICYGHQLLAQAFGGEIDFHPQGMELGTVSISLNAEGKNDELIGILPNPFFGHVIHSQTVKKLPPGAKNLAFNDFEAHHAFRVGENVWGVQFHPEFTAAFLSDFIDQKGSSLDISADELDRIRTALAEYEFGSKLLHQFVDIALANVQ